MCYDSADCNQHGDCFQSTCHCDAAWFDDECKTNIQNQYPGAFLAYQIVFGILFGFLCLFSVRRLIIQTYGAYKFHQLTSWKLYLGILKSPQNVCMVLIALLSLSQVIWVAVDPFVVQDIQPKSVERVFGEIIFSFLFATYAVILIVWHTIYEEISHALRPRERSFLDRSFKTVIMVRIVFTFIVQIGCSIVKGLRLNSVYRYVIQVLQAVLQVNFVVFIFEFWGQGCAVFQFIRLQEKENEGRQGDKKINIQNRTNTELIPHNFREVIDREQFRQSHLSMNKSGPNKSKTIHEYNSSPTANTIVQLSNNNAFLRSQTQKHTPVFHGTFSNPENMYVNNDMNLRVLNSREGEYTRITRNRGTSKFYNEAVNEIVQSKFASGDQPSSRVQSQREINLISTNGNNLNTLDIPKLNILQVDQNPLKQAERFSQFDQVKFAQQNKEEQKLNNELNSQNYTSRSVIRANEDRVNETKVNGDGLNVNMVRANSAKDEFYSQDQTSRAYEVKFNSPKEEFYSQDQISRANEIKFSSSKEEFYSQNQTSRANALKVNSPSSQFYSDDQILNGNNNYNELKMYSPKSQLYSEDPILTQDDNKFTEAKLIDHSDASSPSEKLRIDVPPRFILRKSSDDMSAVKYEPQGLYSPDSFEVDKRQTDFRFFLAPTGRKDKQFGIDAKSVPTEPEKSVILDVDSDTIKWQEMSRKQRVMLNRQENAKMKEVIKTRYREIYGRTRSGSPERNQIRQDELHAEVPIQISEKKSNAKNKAQRQIHNAKVQIRRQHLSNDKKVLKKVLTLIGLGIIFEICFAILSVIVYFSRALQNPGGTISVIWVATSLEFLSAALVFRLFTDVKSKERDNLRWISRVGSGKNKINRLYTFWIPVHELQEDQTKFYLQARINALTVQNSTTGSVSESPAVVTEKW